MDGIDRKIDKRLAMLPNSRRTLPVFDRCNGMTLQSGKMTERSYSVRRGAGKLLLRVVWLKIRANLTVWSMTLKQALILMIGLLLRSTLIFLISCGRKKNGLFIARTFTKLLTRDSKTNFSSGYMSRCTVACSLTKPTRYWGVQPPRFIFKRASLGEGNGELVRSSVRKDRKESLFYY